MNNIYIIAVLIRTSLFKYIFDDIQTMEITRSLCLMLTMGFIGSVRSAVDCNSVSSFQNAQYDCFKAQGLYVTRPFINIPDMGQQSVAYIDVVLKQNPESVCKKPDNFSRALNCLGGINRECGLSSISPTRTLPQIVDKLCIMDTNMNLACAAVWFQDIIECEIKKATEIGSSASSLTPALFCKLYKSQNDCQRSMYNSCGCATVRQYEKIYLDIFYQAVCPESLSRISRVLCDVNNTSIFLNKGVRATGGMSVLTLSLLLAAVLFCCRLVS